MSLCPFCSRDRWEYDAIKGELPEGYERCSICRGILPPEFTVPDAVDKPKRLRGGEVFRPFGGGLPGLGKKR